MNRGPGFESDPRPILPHISVPLISGYSLLPYQNKAPPQIAIAVHFQITKYPGTSQYNWMGFYMIPVKSFLLMSMGKLWMCIFLQIEGMAAIETVVDSHRCICFKFTSHVLLAIPKEMRVQSLIAWPNLSLQQCRSGAKALCFTITERDTNRCEHVHVFLLYMRNAHISSSLLVWLLLCAESEAEEPGDEGSDGPAEESLVGYQCHANAPLISSTSSSSSDPSIFHSILTPVSPDLMAVHLH